MRSILLKQRSSTGGLQTLRDRAIIVWSQAIFCEKKSIKNCIKNTNARLRTTIPNSVFIFVYEYVYPQWFEVLLLFFLYLGLKWYFCLNVMMFVGCLTLIRHVFRIYFRATNKAQHRGRSCSGPPNKPEIASVSRQDVKYMWIIWSKTYWDHESVKQHHTRILKITSSHRNLTDTGFDVSLT